MNRGIIILFGYLKSTILSKVVMAVTGIILLLFLMGHAIGNLQIFLGQETFNAYAHFLQGLGDVLWMIRIFLILALVLHIISLIRLKYINWTAKGRYKVRKYLKAGLTGRTMIWTGILIFAFLLFHLLHFTTGTIDAANFSKNNPEYYSNKAAVFEGNNNENEGLKTLNYKGKGLQQEDDVVLFQRPDAYSMVIKDFQNPLIAIIYIIAMILLGFHLNHAIQSSFQTLGLNHQKYNGFFRASGPFFSILIALCFISIPISIWLGLVGGAV